MKEHYMKYLAVNILITFLISYNCDLQAQWVETSAGGADVQCMIVYNEGLFVGTHAGGVFFSSDDGTNWSVRDTGLTTLNVQNMAASGTNLFAGTYKGGVFLSTNNGGNWTPVNDGLLNLKIYGLAYNPPYVFAGTDGSGLFLSTNNGVSWITAGMSDKTIGDITGNESNIFAGVSYPTRGVYRSIDSCKSWAPTGMVGLTDKNILALTLNGSNLYAGTAYTSLFISTNNGDNWTNLNNGLTDDVWSIIFHNSNIFAGTGHGVYLSTNGGADWINISDGLTNLFAGSLVVHNNYFFAGCGNGGWVWKRPLSELVGIINAHNDLPNEYMLFQNYPNPWNPSTTIKYTIAENSTVSIKVYDILGNEIRSLVNEKKPAGNYEITFSAANIPSGIYFYRLQAGNFIETKKMVFLK